MNPHSLSRCFGAILAVVVLLYGAAVGKQLEVQVESYDAASTEKALIVCIPEIDAAPALDGKLDDAAWKKAAKIERLGTTNGGPADVRTTVYAAFDAKNIYIAFDCEEPAMDRLRVSAAEGEDKWPGDCVEVFIDLGRTRENFYQFVTNSVGAHNDYHNGSNGGWWDGKWKTKSGRTAAGWCAEIAIPWTDLVSNDPQRETVCGINFTRERGLTPTDKDPGGVSMHTWAPMQTFGNPRAFGAGFFGSPERFKHLQGRAGLQIEGTLDKFTYNQHDRVALLALGLTNGEPAGSTLELQLDRVPGTESLGRAAVKMNGPLTGVSVPIEGLAPGKYALHAQAKPAAGEPSNVLAFHFDVVKAAQPAPSGEIKIRRSQEGAADVPSWHARIGVPFPEGALFDTNHVALFTAGGKPVPVQASPLATWSKGGSVKWLGVDVQIPLSAKEQEELTLRYGPDVKQEAGGQIRVTETDKEIAIDTGAARFTVRRAGFNFIDQMWVGERQVIAAGGAEHRGPYMSDEKGQAFWGHLDPESEVTVDEQNPMRTVIRAEGSHRNEGGHTLGRYVVRLYFYSGLPYFRTQHTFIITEDTDKTRYSDIGLRLPAAGSDYRFGTGGEPLAGKLDNGKSVSLLQKRWDQYTVKLNAEQTAPLADGDKAPGWVARGDLAVIVRDFWQNFPKELEADTTGLTVHFWPKNGERVWTPEEEIQPEHAYMLPFVHQGKLLDFEVPEPYFSGPLAQEYGFAYQKNGKWELHYGEAAKHANAMGVGKTHDMLIAFGDAAQPQSLSALRDAFQSDAHFLPDPAWACRTNVAGELPTVDRERFPAQEAYISDGFDFLMRWTLDATHAYGMFNYGDSYHVFRKKNDPALAPGYYRLWAGYHHGRARIPWLFYLRSGDPKYFTWGRANAQHLIDINTCHFTTPEFATQGNDAGKLVGGLTDYKGYVPWHSGNRVGDYNNMVDFILFDYYLTGNGRAKDVADEIGQLLIRHAQGATQREAANLGALLHYFQHTWDARALLKFTTELPKCYKLPAIQHDPASVQWGPYLEPWIAYSNDPEAKRFLLELADTLLDSEKRPTGMHYYGDGRALAMTYRLSGEPKYLYHAWGYYNIGPAMLDDPNAGPRAGVDWLNFSYDTQQMLPVMAHLQARNEKLTLAQPNYAGRGHVKYWPHGDPVNEIRVVLNEKVDGDFWVGAGRFFTRNDVKYELIDPKGEVVQQGVIRRSSVGAERFKIIQMKDGVTGDYTLRVMGADEFQFESTQLSSIETQRFLIPEKLEKNEFVIGGRLFFFVPPECEKFTLTIAGLQELSGRPDRPMQFELRNPDDKPVATKSAREPGKHVIEFTPPAEMRGKVWSVAARNCVLVDVQGVPRWFATSYHGALPEADPK